MAYFHCIVIKAIILTLYIHAYICMYVCMNVIESYLPIDIENYKVKSSLLHRYVPYSHYQSINIRTSDSVLITNLIGHIK